MESEDNEAREQKHLGGKMLFAMWVALFALLALMFNAILDKQYNPNQNLATLTTGDGVRELVLQRNRFGHYVTDGTINNTDVVFMLDTGASDVSIPEDIAQELGLEKGRSMNYQTANGRIRVFATRLDEIAIGDIKLHNVKATINPHFQSDDILLGMSFLKHLEFTQRGDQLTIRQHPSVY